MNRRLSGLILALAVGACSKSPPPPLAPILDPIASPTGATKILITGTAEPGSTIEMTGAVAFDPPTVTANPWTAEFRVIATLNTNAVNDLSFVSVDSHHHRSQPTTVSVQQIDGYGAGLVSVSGVLVNGNSCTLQGSPQACVVAPGDLLEFDISTTNINAVSLGYSAYFQNVNQLETLSVFVPANSPMPTAHFRFTVPGSLFEDVALVAHAVDGSGAEFTSASYLLRTQIAAGDRAVALIAQKGLVRGPNDVALDASGNLFIANDGRNNLLRIPVGSAYPQIFSTYARRSRYLTTSGVGDLYVSDNDLYRVNAAGTQIDRYVTGFNGASQGLMTLQGTRAKAFVNASGATDAMTLVVGPDTYEFDSNGSCPAVAGRFCVNIAGGGSKNAALATAITTNSTVASAAENATSNVTVIRAMTAGEAGNSLALTSSNPGSVVIVQGFQGGHAETVVSGEDGNTFIARLREDLVPTANVLTNNVGFYDVLDPMLGMTLAYETTGTSFDIFDADVYFVDAGNSQRLRARRVVDDPNTVTTTTTFSTTNGGQFDTLYDVALAVNRCLLVSDEVTGRIWSVDVSTRANTNPTIALVASGFDTPRGITISGNDLYVVDNALDAVVKISKSPTANCF